MSCGKEKWRTAPAERLDAAARTFHRRLVARGEFQPKSGKALEPAEK